MWLARGLRGAAGRGADNSGGYQLMAIIVGMSLVKVERFGGVQEVIENRNIEAFFPDTGKLGQDPVAACDVRISTRVQMGNRSRQNYPVMVVAMAVSEYM